jgi:hypothetical protein
MPFRMKIAGKPLGKINKKRRRTLTHQIKEVEMKAPRFFRLVREMPNQWEKSQMHISTFVSARSRYFLIRCVSAEGLLWLRLGLRWHHSN